MELMWYISKMRKSISAGYPNTKKWVEKTRCSRVFFNWLRSVWIPDETLFRVFDLASQTIHNILEKFKAKVHMTFYDLILWPKEEIGPLCFTSNFLLSYHSVTNKTCVFCSVIAKAHRFDEHARCVYRDGCGDGRSVPDPDRRNLLETKSNEGLGEQSKSV